MRGTTLVLGGTGKTGRRVAERLWDAGHRIRLGCRSSDPRFDWSEPSTWAPALDGVTGVYLVYAPDLAVPGAPEAMAAFTDLAGRMGVRRLVLLSARGEPGALRCECVVQAGSADWTILRASWMCQTFSESLLRESVEVGEVALPAGEVAEPFVDAADIADVAVAALTEEGHAGRVYELTGPRLLTFPQALGEIGRALARPIRLVRVSSAEFAAGLVARGAPRACVDALVRRFTTMLDGRNARVQDGVERVLGRRPRDFRWYVRTAVGTGAWRVLSTEAV